MGGGGGGGGIFIAARAAILSCDFHIRKTPLPIETDEYTNREADKQLPINKKLYKHTAKEEE